MRVALRCCLIGLTMAYAALGDPGLTLPVLPPPTLVDGELTETPWAQALRSPAFVRLEIGQQPLDKTEAYVYRSEEKLYLGVRAEFGDAEAETKALAAAKNAYGGDSVEIFIDPGSSGNYCQLAFNAAGQTDFKGLASSIRYAVQLHRTDWTLEAEVPFDAIRIPSSTPSQDWRFNITRTRRALHEHQTWASLSNGTFHEPESFLVLSGIPANLEAIRRAQQERSGNGFEVKTDRLVYDVQRRADVSVRLLPDGSLKGACLLVSLKTAAGECVRQERLSPVLFTNKLSLSLDGLSDGRYLLLTELVSPRGETQKKGLVNLWKVPEQRPRQGPKFEIRDHVMYKDGKFFFPILVPRIGCGGFVSKDMTREQYLARCEAELEDIAAHGINTVVAHQHNFGDEDVEAMKRLKVIPAWDVKTASRCQQEGISFHDFCTLAERHSLLMISPSFWLRGQTAEHLDRFVSHMLKVRDEPNVLAWRIADETDGQVEENLLRHRLCKELDATRPTWLTVINAVSQNIDAADILATDPYPVPNSSLGMVSSHGERLLRNLSGRGGQTGWLWIQLFGNEGNWTRPPSAKELRAMVYLAMNHGVKGLAYFLYVEPAKRDGKRQDPESWEEVGRVNAELRDRAEIFCLGKKVYAAAVKGVDVAAFEYRGQRFLSLVNTSPERSGAVPVGVPGWQETEADLQGLEQSFRQCL